MTPDQRAYYAPLERVVTSIQTKMDTGWYQVNDYADQIDNAMAIAQEAHFDFRDALLQMGILEQSSG